MTNPADRAAPWVDLPRDLTANILQRLSVEDIFQIAQVCTSWWRICQDPSMWRYVNSWYVVGKEREWDKICREVVNRSEGQLISIKLEQFASEDLLLFIAQRAKQLRHLGIWYNSVSDEGFSKAVNEFPLLEDLHLFYCGVSKEGVEAAAQSCPFLNSFTFIKRNRYVIGSCDDEAFSIARNMHRLKHLTLEGNQLTDKGVEAILDGCPRLQSLKLEHCKYATLGGELGKRCSQQIKDLTHIHDPAAYLSDFFIDFVLRDPDKYYEMYLDAVARVGRL